MANTNRTQNIVANGSRMSVRDWPEAERPRERLLRHATGSLSEVELLAVFLRTGLPGKSVLDLARSALDRFGSLNGLLSASHADIEAMPGFEPTKCAQLLAVVELARRALREHVRRERLLDSPDKVREYLRLSIGRLPHEVFKALFLDAQNRLIDDEVLFRGTLTQTSVYPREVVKSALARNAAAVVFAHNHPSGVAEPSRADELLTRTLRDALALVDVRASSITSSSQVTSASPSPSADCSEAASPSPRRGLSAVWSDFRRAGILRSFRRTGRRRMGMRVLVCDGQAKDWRWHHGTRVSSHRKEAARRQQCFARQQQDEAPFLAEPADSAVLGGK